jgi:large subunit ribosomal protein L2
MLIKKKKPTSPGIRHQANIEKNLISKKSQLVKKLNSKFTRKNGKCKQTGHTTVWHKGGGCKKKFRLYTNETNNVLMVIAFIYNPNKNCYASLCFNFKTLTFMLKTTTLNTCIGSLLDNRENTNTILIGQKLAINKIPAGSLVHSITNINGTKEIYIKSAGTFGQIVQKGILNTKIKLPSGKVLFTSNTALATLGCVGNKNYNLQSLGKAGKSFFMGKRPIVRGVAMNPVDHPHGGRTNGGRPSVTPWGKPTKGSPTKKKYVKI